MADTDDLFDDTDGSDDGASESGTEESSSSAPQGDGGNGGESNSKTDKRIADWMSRAQAAEAELNRLKGLDQKGNPKPRTDGRSSDAAAQEAPASQPSEFEGYMRESVRRQLFAEDDRLKEFGFSLEDIAGDSLAEMQASRTRLVKVIEKASSRALNQAFERIGIDPSVAGGPTERKDYAALSDEEFEKEIAKAKGLYPVSGRG